MSSDPVEAASPSRTFRAGWGWLLLTASSRAYLAFVLTLTVCAMLPIFSGWSGSVVQSGSMEPNISPGDVVISQAMPAHTPPPIGLVVTFPAPAGSAKSGFVLHRVVGTNEDGGLVTAGDANADVDSTPLDRHDIVSRARVLIPWIGLPSFWATTGSFIPLVLWMLLTAVALLVEAAGLPGRRPHARSGPPDLPPKETDPSAEPPRWHRDPVPTPISRIRTAVRPAAVFVIALLAAAALAAIPLGRASATFSARTSTNGNSWLVTGPATKLAFTTNPSGSTGGVAFGTQPRVTAQDADGDIVAVSAAPVTLGITTPAGAVLACTTNPRDAVSGVANFAGCKIDKAGTYTLTASSGTLTSAVSASFTVSVGPAAKLAFTASPSNATANTSFTTQPAVTVQDAGGNTVTGSAAPVTLSIPVGAVLTCTANPKSAVLGVATFAGCKIDKPGTYSLTASSDTLTTAISTVFTNSAGPATKLSFTTSPSSSTGGIAFTTQPAVAIQDTNGNTVTSNTAPIALAITTPAGATLTCATNPQNAASGVATFTGCKIDKNGTYTLTATASGLTNSVSSSLTITVGPAATLAFTASPSGATANTSFTTQPKVVVQDTGGNTVTSSTAPITLSLTTPAGATLTCTANPKNASSGVATFAGCKVDKTGTYTLTATSGTFTTVSGTFTITAGAATKVAFTTNPSGAARNVSFTTQPVVTVQDANGNTVTGSSVSVTLTITTPAGALLTCTTNPKSAVSGVVTFAGCKVDKTGTYTLKATASGLTVATSTSFTIT